MNFSLKSTEYKLYFNENSFDLYEIKTVVDEDSQNFGKESELIVGYFSELKYLYSRLVKIGLSKSDIKTFDDILGAVEEVKAELSGLFLPKQ